MNHSLLRIMTWNANGLSQRAHELDLFLKTNSIDVALISETHFSQRSFIKITGYTAYWTTHPSERARGGTAIFIKQNIVHFMQEEIREAYMQGTIVAVKFRSSVVNICAAYYPPKYKITRYQFTEVFKKLGPRFIIGGDFNVKHTAWGSRLITPGKGVELLSAINTSQCEYHSSQKPTYWPTDGNKIPDLIDFFISKGISANYIQIEGIEDLTSDHTPVLLTLSATVLMRQNKQYLTNKRTNWALFREHLDQSINLHIDLKSIDDLEQQTGIFIDNIREAAQKSTPSVKEDIQQEININTLCL